MEYEKKVRIIIIVLLAAVLFVVSWKFLFPIAKYVFFYIKVHTAITTKLYR